MLRRLLLAAVLATGLASPSVAQVADVVQVCGATSGVVSPLGPGGHLTRDVNGNLCVSGSGGGGGGASTITPSVGAQEQDVRTSGSLNAASTSSSIIVPVNGQATLGFTFTGLTASGATVSFFQSNDGGTTYTQVNEVNTGTGVPTGTRSVDGQSRIDAVGHTHIKIQVTTTGTGTITVATTLSVREALFAISAPLPPGTNAIGSVTGGQYNLTLPTLTSGQIGYLAVDSNGRQILAPTSSIGVSSLPALAAGTNTIGSLVNITGTISLPTGAATSANQSSEIAALGTTADTAYAGSGAASIVAALKGVYNGLLAPTPAGTNVIGSTTLRSTGTNRSASVTTTASTLMASNTSRQGWKIKNDCTVAVWIDFDGTATAAAGSGNIQIPAGGYLSSEPGFVETGAMSAIAASGSCALTAREY